ncbi:DMT family transporter [Neisseria weixii]|uniref:DMT family transporter n=1 Tax=Neisseria weixii TaxID=1853276 RepID=A0A3N4MRD1_9NEIS|nr:DMT family transporter [Neisseria weixii]RPD85655.1 DMT family transporter [Neisseria weixii]RPD86195.1 DMT family transporter [Neisseria weixii]
MKPNASFWSTVPLLVLPPLFWAGNFVVGRAVRGDIPPLNLSFGRWAIALAVILPFAWQHMRRDLPLYKQYPAKIVAVSLAGVASFNTLVYMGLHHTTTTNALLLNSCIPVLIMFFGVLFYRQTLLPAQIGGLVLSMSGVLSIILHGEWDNLLAMQFNSGDLIVFAAMICWALYTLWMKTLPAEINRIGLMAVQIIIGLVALMPLWLWETASGAEIVFSPAALLALAYVGLLPSVAAYLLYTMAVEKVGPVRTGLSVHLIPAFGVLLAVLFLSEKLHAYHLIGIVLIACGLVLSNRK